MKKIIIIISICLLVFIACCSSLLGGNGETANTSRTLLTGEEGITYGEGGVNIPIGRTNQDIKDFVSSVVENDKYGGMQLLYSGKIFSVASGTKVLKLSGGSFGYSHIRILEGPFIGVDGYTIMELIRK